LNPLGLHLSHLRRKAQQEKTDEDEDWLHIGTKSGFEVSSTRVWQRVQFQFRSPGASDEPTRVKKTDIRRC
jgi:hypothetical protein